MGSVAARCCPDCGYDLTGAPLPRCAECGREFTEQEWAGPLVFARTPAWERRGRLGWLGRFVRTFLAATFRPGRFLRGVDGEGGTVRVVGYVVLLPAVAWVLAWGFFWLTGLGLHLYAPRGRMAGLFWRRAGEMSSLEGLWAALRDSFLQCAGFVAAGVLVWLPLLIVLDLVCWRQRRVFRLVAKPLLYTLSWWAWAVALAARAANETLCQALDNDWVWGSRGGSSQHGFWPWICWLAALLATAQFAVLVWFVTRGSAWLARETAGTRRALLILLTCGWLVALYLLLLDRHTLLRFELQFFLPQLQEWRIDR